jgi:hypothetical protein
LGILHGKRLGAVLLDSSSVTNRARLHKNGIRAQSINNAGDIGSRALRERESSNNGGNANENS